MVQELRIGNWVKQKRTKTDYYTTIQPSCFSVNIDDNYEKIPLTEQWLLKFGFENEKENHFNIGWFSIWKCNDIFLCDKNGVIIKTVHQLQNLYFSIYQRELKIIK